MVYDSFVHNPVIEDVQRGKVINSETGNTEKLWCTLIWQIIEYTLSKQYLLPGGQQLYI